MKAAISVLYFFCLSSINVQGQALNSYPVAAATVYLDFDGEYVDGTVWNWGGPIQAQPAALSTAQITEIFNRVSEDYRIFNINVTTDLSVYQAAPADQRIRIIVTPTYQWYAPAGGVAFVGSFTWGDDTPAWVFSGLLGNSVKKVAEAISHEAGHTLGLQHQSSYDATCNKTAEYSSGQGTGQIGWAPIMGVGYSRNLTTWHYGKNALSCDSLQDDIEVIAASIADGGFRADDHSDLYANATPIHHSGYQFGAEGLINSATDKDVFSFTIPSPTNFRISAVPTSAGDDNDGANVDIKVSVLNQQGDTIGRYNPMDLLNAGADSNMNAGTYYLVVEGVGNPNLADYGSVGYYSISGSLGNVLPVHNVNLSGLVQGGNHILNWSFTADESVKRIEVEYAPDGKHFATLAQLDPETNRFTWKPVGNIMAYYRVRIITVEDERAYYSKTITLPASVDQPVKLYGTVINDVITVYTGRQYAYSLFDGAGRLLQQGRLSPGTSTVAVPNLQKGLFMLRLQGNNESYSFRLIKP